MAEPKRCHVCLDLGFVNAGGEVEPCPNCNEDSGYAPGEYAAFWLNDAIDKHGRCDYAKGGGGRTCYLPTGHVGDHIFQCGG